MSIRNRIPTLLLLLLSLTTSLFAQDDQKAKETARAFIELLKDKNYEQATLMTDSSLRAQLPPARLQMAWESLLTQAGDYGQIMEEAIEKRGPYTMVIQTTTFSRAHFDIKITLTNKYTVAGLFFSPAKPKLARPAGPPYEKTDRFREQQLTLVNGQFKLPGMLTMPVASGRVPVVILVHGSGPNDWDETIGPNKPFRDIAVGLSSMGIAVFRYNKRTQQYGPASAPADSVTLWHETISDAIAAADMLKSDPRIDTNNIFVLGHSLGGMSLPRILAARPWIKGGIIMAGNARPMEDLVLEQVEYLVSIDGKQPEDKEQIDALKKQVKNVKSSSLSYATPAANLPLNLPASYWIYLNNYNQTKEAAHLKQPILVLQGERDYQVTMKDFSLWKKALKKNKGAKFQSYPTLNHLFQEGQGKSKPSEYENQAFIPEYVITDIAQWIMGK